MADLSPKLMERRRKRETRDRPWRDAKPLSPMSFAYRSSLPGTPTAQKLLRRRAEITRSLRKTVVQAEFHHFLRLPFDIQLLIGEYVVYSEQTIKCEDFIPYKDGKFDNDAKAEPKFTLSPEGYPTWIPLIEVCPWLSKDLSRTWYRENTFFVRSVIDWNAFRERATWKNASRIPHLHVDNEFIYCLGSTVDKDADWRSHEILSLMTDLKTLTLYRDDGGPGTYTQGGHDEFNSVDWFVTCARNCKRLQKIKFSLYPWSGFDPYLLADSNMVAWVIDWEHEWDAVMAKRRPKENKPSQSWCLASIPAAV